MSRFFRWVISIVLIATILNACTPGESPPPTPTLEKMNARIRLEIWLPEQDIEFYTQLAEAFEQENPDINLHFKEIPQSDYIEQLDQAVKANKGPDLALVADPQLLADGDFLPLEELIKQFHIPIEDYNQGALAKSCILNNRLYCLGTYTSGYMIFYNPELLAEYGRSFPAAAKSLTMVDLVNLVRVYKEDSPDPEDQVWGSSFPFPYLWSDRRTLFSIDGRKAYRLANDEATVNAYQALVDSCKEQFSVCQTNDDGETASAMISLFLRKRLAVLITKSHLALPEIEKARVAWGASFVPTEKPSDARWTTAWTDGFGVLTTSPHQEESLRFLAFLGNRGSELRAEAGDVPLNMRTAQKWAGSQKSRNQVINVLQAAGKDIFVPEFPRITIRLDQAIENMINEDLSAKDALDIAAPLMQGDLDQSWNRFDAIQNP